jgi:FtsK/SpoIIIE family
MNHEIVPEHKPPIDGHMIVDICLIALIPVTFLLAASFHAWGFMTTFIGVLVLLGLGTIAMLFFKISHHLRESKERKHMMDLAREALRNGHSVQLKHPTGHELSTISPLTIPDGPLTIKDVTLGGQAQLPAPAIAQPRLDAVIDELTPNALEFPFGVSRETGETVKSSLVKAVHLNAIGDTGGGKSTGAQGILAALSTMNDPAHLSLAFVDAESETTLPFHHLPHVRYLADDPRDAAAIFAELVRVLNQRHITKQMLPFILLFCEEFLTLRKRMPESVKAQALDDFTELACGGRKRNIALYTIGQTAYSDKAIRDAQAQFQTNMAYAIHPQRARAAGFVETPLLNQVYKEKRAGQFVLEHKGTNSIILAPHIDRKTVESLVGSQVVPGEFPVSSQIDNLSSGNHDGRQPEIDTGTLLVVRELVAQRKSQNEIIAAAFPNMRNVDATAEFRKYLAYLVRERN